MTHKLESLHQQADQIIENIINDHKEAKSKAKVTKRKQQILWMFSYSMRMVSNKIFL